MADEYSQMGIDELRHVIKEKDRSLKATKSDYAKAVEKVGRLAADLDIASRQELKLHTTLKLRTTIEKLEELMRPDGVARDEWEKVSRVDKWTKFFTEPKIHDGYEEFILCVQSISDDPFTLAKKVKKIYGILNGRVHNYVDHKEIDDSSFREVGMKKLAACLGSYRCLEIVSIYEKN